MNHKLLVLMIVVVTATMILIQELHSAWITEIVDPGDGQIDSGRFTCLKIDSNGYPQIAYQMSGNPKFAYLDSSGWHMEVIEDDPDTGWWISMALDTADHPHLSYMDYLNAQVRYTYKDATGWHFEIVDDSAIGGDTSMVLDSASRVHIAYKGAENDELRYAHGTDDGWERVTVDSGGIFGNSISLKLNSNSSPYISYYEWESKDLLFARCNPGGWQYFTIDTEGRVGICNSLAVDQSDFPHISYFDSDNHALKYARRDVSGVHIETLDTEMKDDTDTSIVIDSINRPHIAYIDRSGPYVKYAWNDGNTWHFDTIETARAIHYVSLDLDDNGLAWISYQGSGNNLSVTREVNSPTPTPTVSGISYDLMMPDVSIQPGDDFLFLRTSYNTQSHSEEVDEYIILDVLGSYWYWPSWGTDPDWRPWTLDAGRNYTEEILHFIWPQSSGAFSGVVFWGGMLEAGTVNLLNYDMISWDYFE